MSMTITITIQTHTAAFEEDRAGEVARILHHVAEKYSTRTARGSLTTVLRDSNGNSVGFVTDEDS